MLSMLYLCTQITSFNCMYIQYIVDADSTEFLFGHNNLLLILVAVCVPQYDCWVWSLYVVLDIVAGCVSECIC